MLLKDTCPIAAAIMSGEHDEHLHYIIQAAQARQKNAVRATGLRAGARVTFTDKCRDKRIVGTTVTVEKVNQKTFDTDDFMRVPLSWLNTGQAVIA